MCCVFICIQFRNFFFFFFFFLAACHVIGSVSQPGIEPVAPAMEAQRLNHRTSKEVPIKSFFFKKEFYYMLGSQIMINAHCRDLCTKAFSKENWACFWKTPPWVSKVDDMGGQTAPPVNTKKEPKVPNSYSSHFALLSKQNLYSSGKIQ